jgi:putative DNA primase/helicase
LFPAHREELQASGLTDEMIVVAGIYSEPDRRKLAALLNRKSWSPRMGSALVFPYRDASGAVVLNRVKPERPQERNGKPIKYLSPSGSIVRAYFPPGTHLSIANGTTEIVITEGEKKALAGCQAGFCVVGLPGVDCWHRSKSTALLPELEGIEWGGRTAFIIFDSDTANNCRVRENVVRLAAALERHKAIVKVVWLPAGPDGGKVGLDDFLLAHGAAELRRLMDQAEPPDSPAPSLLKSPAAEADPADVAGSIIDGSKHDGVPRLLHWRESWWWWSHGRYVKKLDSEVRAQVVNHCVRDYFQVKGRHVSDVMEHLRAKSILDSSMAPPTWLSTKTAPFDASECLPMRDRIVHLPSLIDGHELWDVAATPALLTVTACDFNLDREAPRPDAWLAFLNSLWGSDHQSIETLQEIFGYLLTADTRQQKIFSLIGPRRSGKGTIARVIRKLVGEGNVAGPTLSSLATNFGLATLLGKSVAIVSDARLSGRPDKAVVVERLLAISGEDKLTIDRKHKEAVDCTLPTRFVLLSNELPRLDDASATIISRFILLQTTRSFYGCEDHGLDDKLFAELPGILLWSIQGWQRLRARGRFMQPDSALQAIAELNDLASPVTAFVRDCCVVGPTEAVVIGDLYAAWQRWCREQGRESFTTSRQIFGRDLRAALPGIESHQPRDGGSRSRAYQGIALREGP